MSIIHEALKKVQHTMTKGDSNPEDIVEILPSSNPDKPAGSDLKSFLIILVCLIITGASLYLGYNQLNQQYPQLFSKVNLPNANKIQKNIEKAIGKSPVGSMVQPLMKTKAPAKPKVVTNSKPLAQIKIQTAQPKPTLNSTTNQTDSTTSTVNSNSSTTITRPGNSEAQASANVLTIQGIMSNNTGNVALINNNVYEEGSTVDGVKILKITLKEITVDHNGKLETISINK